MTYEEYLDEVTTLITEKYDVSDEDAIKHVMRAQANRCTAVVHCRGLMHDAESQPVRQTDLATSVENPSHLRRLPK